MTTNANISTSASTSGAPPINFSEMYSQYVPTENVPTLNQKPSKRRVWAPRPATAT